MYSHFLQLSTLPCTVATNAEQRQYTAQKAQTDLLRVYLLAKESLEVEKCSCLSLLVQRAHSRQPFRPFPVQTSSPRYPLWRFRRNHVEKPRSPHSRRSCRRIPLHGSISRRPVAVSTPIDDCQVRTRANYSANPSKWEYSHGCFEAAT